MKIAPPAPEDAPPEFAPPMRRAPRTSMQNLRADAAAAAGVLGRVAWRRSLAAAAVCSGAALAMAAAMHPPLMGRLSAVYGAASAYVSAGGGQRVTEIRILGRDRLSPEDVAALAGLKPEPLFWEYDVAAARDRLASHPWVRAASVTKEPPGRATVAIEERVAAAVWRVGDETWLIDRDGAPIEQASSMSARLDLPLLIGADAAERVAGARALLAGAPPDLLQEITALQSIDGRRWNALTQSGPVLMLPMRDAQAALYRLNELNRRYALLARDVTVLDLRESPVVAARLGPTAQAALSLGAGLEVRP